MKKSMLVCSLCAFALLGLGSDAELNVGTIIAFVILSTVGMIAALKVRAEAEK